MDRTRDMRNFTFMHGLDLVVRQVLGIIGKFALADVSAYAVLVRQEPEPPKTRPPIAGVRRPNLGAYAAVCVAPPNIVTAVRAQGPVGREA
jgi:hypothetical protein